MRKGGLRTTYLTEVVEVSRRPGARPARRSADHRAAGSLAGQHRRPLPVADAVFVGDALTTRHVLTGQQGPQPAPFTDEPGEAIASLGRLEALSATWVLPGHGTPWNGGVKEAVRQVNAAR